MACAVPAGGGVFCVLGATLGRCPQTRSLLGRELPLSGGDAPACFLKQFLGAFTAVRI